MKMTGLPKRPLTNEEWNSVRAAIWDLKQFLQNGLGLRNTFGDRVIIKDEIRIYEGEGANKKLKVKSKGHIVNQGLIAITNLLSWSTITYSSSSNGGLSSYNKAREVAETLKSWLLKGKFLLTEPVTSLPGA